MRLPAGGHAESRVRCPHCREEYRLDEVFAKLPPMLELVDEEGGLTDGFGRMLGEMPIGDQARFEGLVPPGGLTQTIKTTPRRRSRERSPVVEFAKIAGGGVAGLVLAQMILFWVPGNFSSRQRDPLRIAPRIAKIVPAVVPRELRGGDDWSPSETGSETLIDAESGRVIRSGIDSRRESKKPTELPENGPKKPERDSSGSGAGTGDETGAGDGTGESTPAVDDRPTDLPTAEETRKREDPDLPSPPLGPPDPCVI